MKHDRFVSVLIISSALFAFAAAPAAKNVTYDTYDGYFVSNKFEPKAPTSFVVIKDQKTFDETFGVAMVMGDKSHRLPADAFDSLMVVSAIHRGKAFWDYKVQSVQLEGKTLIVKYKTNATPNKDCEFSCPLIISVPKGEYTSVKFIENGKEINKVDMACS